MTHAHGLSPSAPGSIIYFGTFEVESGKLKSADGVPPQAGQRVTLAVDVLGLSTAVACRPGDQRCASLEPRLYVRYSGSAPFQEMSGLPKGYISGRGPKRNHIVIDFSNQLLLELKAVFILHFLADPSCRGPLVSGGPILISGF
ncbi:MAG: hypothetical protein ACXVB4_02090 [Pseudobdellovibrionaceae bacterium]